MSANRPWTCSSGLAEADDPLSLESVVIELEPLPGRPSLRRDGAQSSLVDDRREVLARGASVRVASQMNDEGGEIGSMLQDLFDRDGRPFHAADSWKMHAVAKIGANEAALEGSRDLHGTVECLKR